MKKNLKNFNILRISIMSVMFFAIVGFVFFSNFSINTNLEYSSKLKNINLNKQLMVPKTKNHETYVKVNDQKIIFTIDGSTFDIDNEQFRTMISNLSEKQIKKISEDLQLYAKNEQLRSYIIRKLISKLDNIKNGNALKNIKFIARPLIDHENYAKRIYFEKALEIVEEDIRNNKQ